LIKNKNIVVEKNFENIQIEMAAVLELMCGALHFMGEKHFVSQIIEHYKH
jgi:hypothetical protein